MLLGLATALPADAQTIDEIARPSTDAVEPGFRSALLSFHAFQVDGAPSGTANAPPAVAIDWARAQHDADRQTGDPVRLVNSRASDLALVTLPVLLPDQGTLGLDGARARLFAREHFYTASVIGDGMIVEVFGTRQRHAVPPDPATERRIAEARDAQGYLVTQGEGSWDVAFNRYGAAYSVIAECADPADARCEDGDYARGVAVSLLVAGGQPDGN